MGWKKDKITQLRKEGKRHEADILAAGGQDAQIAKWNSKLRRGKIDELQHERIGLDLGFLRLTSSEVPAAPTPSSVPAPPGTITTTGQLPFWETDEWKTVVQDNRVNPTRTFDVGSVIKWKEAQEEKSKYQDFYSMAAKVNQSPDEPMKQAAKPAVKKSLLPSRPAFEPLSQLTQSINNWLAPQRTKFIDPLTGEETPTYISSGQTMTIDVPPSYQAQGLPAQLTVPISKPIALYSGPVGFQQKLSSISVEPLQEALSTNPLTSIISQGISMFIAGGYGLARAVYREILNSTYGDFGQQIIAPHDSGLDETFAEMGRYATSITQTVTSVFSDNRVDPTSIYAISPEDYQKLLKDGTANEQVELLNGVLVWKNKLDADKSNVEQTRQVVYSRLSQIDANGEEVSDAEWQSLHTQIVDSIRTEQNFTFSSPANAWTWNAYPEKKIAFEEEWARQEMLLRRPLEKWEIIDLRRNYEESTAQLGGELIFDWMNVPLLFDNLLLKPTVSLLKTAGGALLRGTGAVVGKVPILGDVVRFFGRQANASVAAQVERDVQRVFGEVAQHANDSDSFFTMLDDYERVVSQFGKVENKKWIWERSVEELLPELRRINPAITETEVEMLRRIVNAIPPAGADQVSKWSLRAERVRQAAGEEIRLMMQRRYELMTGDGLLSKISRIVPDAAERELIGLSRDKFNQLSAAAVRTFIDDPKNLMPRLAREFYNSQRTLGAVPWSRLIPKDSLLGIIGEVSRGAKLRFPQQAFNLWAQSYDWFRTLWVNAVLGLRPAWFVNNYLDSYFRYGITYGKGMFQNINDIVRPFRLGLDVLPPDAAISFGGEFSKAFGAQGEVFKLLESKPTPWNLIRTLNSKLEFSLRLRLIENKRWEILSQIMGPMGERILSKLPEELRPLGAEILRVSRNNPARATALVDSVFARMREGKAAWSVNVPDAVLETALGRSLEYQARVIGPIEDELYKLRRTAELAGRSLTEVEIREFFAGVRRQWDDVAREMERLEDAARAADEIPLGIQDDINPDDINRTITPEEQAEIVGEQQRVEQEQVTRVDEWDNELSEPVNIAQNEQQQANERLRQTAMSDFFKQRLPTFPSDIAPIAMANMSTFADRIRDLAQFRINYFPGPAALRKREGQFWDLVFALEDELNKRLPAYLEKTANEIAGLTNDTVAAYKWPTLEDLPQNMSNFKLVRDANGRITEISMPVLVPGFAVKNLKTRNQAAINKFEEMVLGILPEPKQVPFSTVVENFPENQILDDEQLWKALAESQGLSSQYGSAAVRTYPDFIRYLDNRIEREVTKGLGDTFFVRGYRQIREEAEQLMGFLRSSRFPDVFNLTPPPIPKYQLSDGWATWAYQKAEILGDYAKFNDMIDVWENGLIQAGDIPTLGRYTDEQLIQFGDWSKSDLIPEMSRVREVAYYGGNYDALPDITFEGAIPFTNRVNIDYQHFTTFDQTMRSIVPFWMFTSRSVPFWMETMLLHPEIPAWYATYLRHADRANYQKGLITTYGDPLPSFEGYIELGSTGIYFNPLASLSFRYAIPLDDGNYETEDKSENMLQSVVRNLYERSREYGLFLGPWVNALLYMTHGLDPDRTTLTPIFPQVNLLPPTWRQTLREATRHVSQMGADLLFPVLNWKDHLIENRMYYDAAAAFPSLTYEERIKRLQEIETALRQRDESDLWTETLARVDNEDWVKSVAGYFTAVYPKPLTSGQIEVIQIRTINNSMRDMLNSQVGAEMLGLSSDIQAREELFNQYRFDTPDGWLANLYNSSRYVMLPTGEPAHGTQRREIMAQQLLIEQENRSYYNGKTRMYREFDAALQAAGIGAPDEVTDAIYDRLFTGLDALEETNPHAERMWTRGVKSYATIQKHFENIWWGIISETRPHFNPDTEVWSEYKLRVLKWEEELPKKLPFFTNFFSQWYLRYLGENSQPFKGTLDSLRKSTNAEGYNEWVRSNDSTLQAINNAWEALRADVFYSMTEGQKGAAYELALRDYQAKYGNDPTVDEIYAWIVQTYGEDKFTRDEVAKIWTASEKWTMQERRQEEQEARFGDVGAKADEVWTILRMAGPGGSSDLRTAYRQAGGDESDIDTWYAIQNPTYYKDPQDFLNFYNILRQAAATLDLQQPTTAELRNWAGAEKLNEQFNAVVEQKLPGITDLLSTYYNLSTSERRTWRKQNPDQAAAIQQYYDFKDDYSIQYPLWGKYYWPPEGTPSAAGNLPLSNRGGVGVVSTRPTRPSKFVIPRELYGLNPSDKEKLQLYFSGKGGLAENFKKRLNATWLELGKPSGSFDKWLRNEVKPRFQSRGKSSKGSGKPDKSNPLGWPPELIALVGQTAYQEALNAKQSGGEISTETLQYLRGVAERNPEWRKLIRQAIY